MQRTTLDSRAGLTIPVDKMIGDAFPIVDLVSRNLDPINYLVANMEAVILVAQSLAKEAVILATGQASTIGVEASIPFPAEVTSVNLRGFDVLLLGSNGDIHLPGVHYTAEIIGGALKVVLLAGTPPTLVGGEIRWRMSYGIDP